MFQNGFKAPGQRLVEIRTQPWVSGYATGVFSSRKIAKLDTIAVDGTKVKANVSRHKAMSYGHMLKVEAELKAQIDALLKRAQQADEAEKNEPELDTPAEIARREERRRRWASRPTSSWRPNSRTAAATQANCR